jgi:hypothetical protein
VATLAADHAQVLTFVTQHDTRVDTGARSTGLTQVLLGLVREGEAWRIDELEADPVMAEIEPSVELHPLAKERDALLAAAQSPGAVLVSLDATDPEGTMDAFESVAVDPLLAEIREGRAANVDQLIANGTVAKPDAPAAVAALKLDNRAGTAVVLLTLKISVTQPGQNREQRAINVRMGLSRTEQGWLASSVDLIRLTP